MPIVKSTAVAAGLTALLTSASLAQAADFTFEGNIAFHNDVIQIAFTLDADATDVKVWTDGFLDGVNFDPITAVWSLPTGNQVGENDDDDTIAPGQTYYDSGLIFPTLPAGNYLFTIAAYPNFASTGNLAGGFEFDNEVPIPIGSWCQPAAADCDDPVLNQKGTYWRVHLSGVDVATNVPEPSTYAMLAFGLAVVGGAVRARRSPAARR